MNKSILLTGGVCACIALAACHKSANFDQAGAAPAADAPKPTGNATAEEVAAEARGNVSCPATASVPRQAGAPVDDVVGVRPGMSWGEAAHFAMCDNPLLVVKEVTDRNFRMNTYGAKVRQAFVAEFAEPRIQKSGQEIVREMQEESMRRMNNAREDPLQAGQTRYFVSTMGLPGQEKVVSVAREEYYATGKSPTVESIEGALKAKYGTPTQALDQGPAIRELQWKYDPGGRLITETSPLFSSCYANASPDAGTNLSPDCGVTVTADIKRASDNPGLAHSLAVVSQNGAEGYKRIEDTEQALMQVDQKRKAEELKGASQSADTPKL